MPASRAGDRIRPSLRAFDQPDLGALQPGHQPFGLLGGGTRRRARTGSYGLRRGQQHGECGAADGSVVPRWPAAPAGRSGSRAISQPRPGRAGRPRPRAARSGRSAAACGSPRRAARSAGTASGRHPRSAALRLALRSAPVICRRRWPGSPVTTCGNGSATSRPYRSGVIRRSHGAAQRPSSASAQSAEARRADRRRLQRRSWQHVVDGIGGELRAEPGAERARGMSAPSGAHRRAPATAAERSPSSASTRTRAPETSSDGCKAACGRRSVAAHGLRPPANGRIRSPPPARLCGSSPRCACASRRQ